MDITSPDNVQCLTPASPPTRSESASPPFLNDGGIRETAGIPPHSLRHGVDSCGVDTEAGSSSSAPFQKLKAAPAHLISRIRALEEVNSRNDGDEADGVKGNTTKISDGDTTHDDIGMNMSGRHVHVGVLDRREGSPPRSPDDTDLPRLHTAAAEVAVVFDPSSADELACVVGVPFVASSPAEDGNKPKDHMQCIPRSTVVCDRYHNPNAVRTSTEEADCSSLLLSHGEASQHCQGGVGGAPPLPPPLMHQSHTASSSIVSPHQLLSHMRSSADMWSPTGDGAANVVVAAASTTSGEEGGAPRPHTSAAAGHWVAERTSSGASNAYGFTSTAVERLSSDAAPQQQHLAATMDSTTSTIAMPMLPALTAAESTLRGRGSERGGGSIHLGTAATSSSFPTIVGRGALWASPSASQKQQQSPSEESRRVIFNSPNKEKNNNEGDAYLYEDGMATATSPPAEEERSGERLPPIARGSDLFLFDSGRKERKESEKRTSMDESKRRGDDNNDGDEASDELIKCLTAPRPATVTIFTSGGGATAVSGGVISHEQQSNNSNENEEEYDLNSVNRHSAEVSALASAGRNRSEPSPRCSQHQRQQESVEEGVASLPQSDQSVQSTQPQQPVGSRSGSATSETKGKSLSVRQRRLHYEASLRERGETDPLAPNAPRPLASNIRAAVESAKERISMSRETSRASSPTDSLRGVSASFPSSSSSVPAATLAAAGGVVPLLAGGGGSAPSSRGASPTPSGCSVNGSSARAPAPSAPTARSRQNSRVGVVPSFLRAGGSVALFTSGEENPQQQQQTNSINDNTSRQHHRPLAPSPPQPMPASASHTPRRSAPPLAAEDVFEIEDDMSSPTDAMRNATAAVPIRGTGGVSFVGEEEGGLVRRRSRGNGSFRSCLSGRSSPSPSAHASANAADDSHMWVIPQMSQAEGMGTPSTRQHARDTEEASNAAETAIATTPSRLQRRLSGASLLDAAFGAAAANRSRSASRAEERRGSSSEDKYLVGHIGNDLNNENDNNTIDVGGHGGQVRRTHSHGESPSPAPPTPNAHLNTRQIAERDAEAAAAAAKAKEGGSYGHYHHHPTSVFLNFASNFNSRGTSNAPITPPIASNGTSVGRDDRESLPVPLQQTLLTVSGGQAQRSRRNSNVVVFVPNANAVGNQQQNEGVDGPFGKGGERGRSERRRSDANDASSSSAARRTQSQSGVPSLLPSEHSSTNMSEFGPAPSVLFTPSKADARPCGGNGNDAMRRGLPVLSTDTSTLPTSPSPPPTPSNLVGCAVGGEGGANAGMPFLPRPQRPAPEPAPAEEGGSGSDFELGGDEDGGCVPSFSPAPPPSAPSTPARPLRRASSARSLDNSTSSSPPAAAGAVLVGAAALSNRSDEGSDFVSMAPVAAATVTPSRSLQGPPYSQLATKADDKEEGDNKKKRRNSITVGSRVMSALGLDFSPHPSMRGDGTSGCDGAFPMGLLLGDEGLSRLRALQTGAPHLFASSSSANRAQNHNLSNGGASTVCEALQGIVVAVREESAARCGSSKQSATAVTAATGMNDEGEEVRSGVRSRANSTNLSTFVHARGAAEESLGNTSSIEGMSANKAAANKNKKSLKSKRNTYAAVGSLHSHDDDSDNSGTGSCTSVSTCSSVSFDSSFSSANSSIVGRVAARCGPLRRLASSHLLKSSSASAAAASLSASLQLDVARQPPPHVMRRRPSAANDVTAADNEGAINQNVGSTESSENQNGDSPDGVNPPRTAADCDGDMNDLLDAYMYDPTAASAGAKGRRIGAVGAASSAPASPTSFSPRCRAEFGQKKQQQKGDTESLSALRERSNSSLNGGRADVTPRPPQPPATSPPPLRRCHSAVLASKVTAVPKYTADLSSTTTLAFPLSEVSATTKLDTAKWIVEFKKTTAQFVATHMRICGGSHPFDQRRRKATRTSGSHDTDTTASNKKHRAVPTATADVPLHEVPHARLSEWKAAYASLIASRKAFAKNLQRKAQQVSLSQCRNAFDRTPHSRRRSSADPSPQAATEESKATTAVPPAGLPFAVITDLAEIADYLVSTEGDCVFGPVGVEHCPPPASVSSAFTAPSSAALGRTHIGGFVDPAGLYRPFGPTVLEALSIVRLTVAARPLDVNGTVVAAIAHLLLIARGTATGEEGEAITPRDESSEDSSGNKNKLHSTFSVGGLVLAACRSNSPRIISRLLSVAAVRDALTRRYMRASMMAITSALTASSERLLIFSPYRRKPMSMPAKATNEGELAAKALLTSALEMCLALVEAAPHIRSAQKNNGSCGTGDGEENDEDSLDPYWRRMITAALCFFDVANEYTPSGEDGASISNGAAHSDDLRSTARAAANCPRLYGERFQKAIAVAARRRHDEAYERRIDELIKHSSTGARPGSGHGRRKEPIVASPQDPQENDDDGDGDAEVDGERERSAAFCAFTGAPAIAGSDTFSYILSALLFSDAQHRRIASSHNFVSGILSKLQSERLDAGGPSSRTVFTSLPLYLSAPALSAALGESSPEPSLFARMAAEQYEKALEIARTLQKRILNAVLFTPAAATTTTTATTAISLPQNAAALEFRTHVYFFDFFADPSYVPQAMSGDAEEEAADQCTSEEEVPDSPSHFSLGHSPTYNSDFGDPATAVAHARGFPAAAKYSSAASLFSRVCWAAGGWNAALPSEELLRQHQMHHLSLLKAMLKYSFTASEKAKEERKEKELTGDNNEIDNESKDGNVPIATYPAPCMTAAGTLSKANTFDHRTPSAPARRHFNGGAECGDDGKAALLVRSTADVTILHHAIISSNYPLCDLVLLGGYIEADAVLRHMLSTPLEVNIDVGRSVASHKNIQQRGTKAREVTQTKKKNRVALPAAVARKVATDTEDEDFVIHSEPPTESEPEEVKTASESSAALDDAVIGPSGKAISSRRHLSAALRRRRGAVRVASVVQRAVNAGDDHTSEVDDWIQSEEECEAVASPTQLFVSVLGSGEGTSHNADEKAPIDRPVLVFRTCAELASAVLEMRRRAANAHPSATNGGDGSSSQQQQNYQSMAAHKGRLKVLERHVSNAEKVCRIVQGLERQLLAATIEEKPK